MDSEHFGCLPPHWLAETPDSLLTEAVEAVFGGNYDPEFRPVLIRVLASMVHHAGSVASGVKPNSKVLQMAPFSSAGGPGGLLERLKTFVTTDRASLHRTGVPTSVDMLESMRELMRKQDAALTALTELSGGMAVQTMALIDAMKKFLEGRAFEQGVMTIDSMKTMLNSMSQSIIAQISSNAGAAANPGPSPEPAPLVATGTTPAARVNLHYYRVEGSDTTWWHVPRGFKFPEGLNLESGWDLWVSGCSARSIRPYHQLDTKFLPGKALKSAFATWKSIFGGVMQPGAGAMPQEPQPARHLWNEAHNELKRRASFAFTPEYSARRQNWAIASWAKHTKYGYIMEHGTVADKAALPAAGGKNKKRRKTTQAGSG